MIRRIGLFRGCIYLGSVFGKSFRSFFDFSWGRVLGLSFEMIMSVVCISCLSFVGLSFAAFIILLSCLNEEG